MSRVRICGKEALAELGSWLLQPLHNSEIQICQVHVAFGQNVNGQTLRPFGSFTWATSFIRFQWCHCRQASGSPELKVEIMFSSWHNFFPLRSKVIFPP